MLVSQDKRFWQVTCLQCNTACRQQSSAGAVAYASTSTACPTNTTDMFSHRFQPQRQVRIVRIFNTYGPKMALDDGRVVSNFVAQALTNQPITVYGEGTQTRSFQYVSDLIAGMVAVMDGDEIGPFNIGNPGEFNMLELANVSACKMSFCRILLSLLGCLLGWAVAACTP